MSLQAMRRPLLATSSRITLHHLAAAAAYGATPVPAAARVARAASYATAQVQTATSSAQAAPLARPVDTRSGFEGVPAPAYAGPVSGGKTTQAADKPKRREIKSRKAALSMTPAALDRLRALSSSPSSPKLLRIGVKTRGCAGMAYHLDYVDPPGGRFDEVVEQDGVRVLIDSKALFSIIGSKMDWRDNRLSAGFVFDK